MCTVREVAGGKDRVGDHRGEIAGERVRHRQAGGRADHLIAWRAHRMMRNASENVIASPTAAAADRSKLATVLRVTSGNFLEMFDFFLFGFYATYIAKTFFPVSNEYASLMLTFVTFGAGFLMRPLGAIVLGSYIDRIGRRKGLIVTLSIMACGTLMI